MLLSRLLVILSLALLLAGCADKKSKSPNPDDLEGGSGAGAAAADWQPSGTEDLLTPKGVEYMEKTDDRVGITADELPVSRGGVVPDTAYYAANADNPSIASVPVDPTPSLTEPAADEKGKYVRVWFATNRAMTDPADATKGFSALRDPDDKKMHIGSVVCYVPFSRPVGTLGSSWVARQLKGEDDRIRVAELIVDSDESYYYLQMKRRLARAPENERSILLYIHGYKNSFENAALRAAQLAVDLDVPGLTAFYSWPSRGELSGYTADEAAVETAERHLTTYITKLSSETGATNIHIIAHSMGNRLLARTMHRVLSKSAANKNSVKFGQIVLAAPDMDLSTFRDLAEVYPAISNRTTLYVSKKDMALESSAWVHSYPRAGYAPPVAIVPGIDTIEVTQVDVSALGHGYVAEAKSVLADVAELLRTGKQPHERVWLHPSKTDTGDAFWLMKDAEPTPAPTPAQPAPQN